MARVASAAHGAEADAAHDRKTLGLEDAWCEASLREGTGLARPSLAAPPRLCTAARARAQQRGAGAERTGGALQGAAQPTPPSAEVPTPPRARPCRCRRDRTRCGLSQPHSWLGRCGRRLGTTRARTAPAARLPPRAVQRARAPAARGRAPGGAARASSGKGALARGQPRTPGAAGFPAEADATKHAM